MLCVTQGQSILAEIHQAVAEERQRVELELGPPSAAVSEKEWKRNVDVAMEPFPIAFFNQERSLANLTVNTCNPGNPSRKGSKESSSTAVGRPTHVTPDTRTTRQTQAKPRQVEVEVEVEVEEEVEEEEEVSLI